MVRVVRRTVARYDAGMKKALVFAWLVLTAASAWANGRDPYTSTIHFQRGAEQNIYAGMTFGLLVSHDNGATWQWMCEKAVGYGGLFDPDYEVLANVEFNVPEPMLLAQMDQQDDVMGRILAVAGLARSAPPG